MGCFIRMNSILLDFLISDVLFGFMVARLLISISFYSFFFLLNFNLGGSL